MGVSARFRFVTAFAVTALFLTSCGGGSSAALSAAVGASEPITFTTDDGVQLAGRLFGPADARAGVVLAHMLPADQRAWYPFAQRLAEQGFRVLTFDFRGYCPGGDGGCSEGTKQVDAAPSDLQAAVDRLRADGVERVGIAGASMGGTAALLVAAEDPRGIPAVVSVSAPQVIDHLAVGPEVLTQAAGAKLFIAGLGDPSGAVAAADAMSAMSPQPSHEEIVTDDAHGTDLLTSAQGEHVQELIEGWFTQWLAAAACVTASRQGLGERRGKLGRGWAGERRRGRRLVELCDGRRQQQDEQNDQGDGGGAAHAGRIAIPKRAWPGRAHASRSGANRGRLGPGCACAGRPRATPPP